MAIARLAAPADSTSNGVGFPTVRADRAPALPAARHGGRE